MGNMDRTREEAGRIVKKLLWWLRKWYLGSGKNSGNRGYSGLAMDSNNNKKEMKGHFKVSGLRNWKDKVPFPEM